MNRNTLFFMVSLVTVVLSMELSAQNSILWGTYYGSTAEDKGMATATDPDGHVYIAGHTSSTTNIADGGFQNTYGGGNADAYLVKLDSAGNRLWATYYGSTGDDYATGIATDGSGNVYLCGYTNSASNIASSGFQNTIGGLNDAFLVKFDSAGSRVWATYYGGLLDEVGYSAATDASGNVFLAGNTGSINAIASAGFQDTLGGDVDAFVVKFNSSGSRLWGTYYGGAFTDHGYCVSVDPSGNAFLAGRTNSLLGIASITPPGFQVILLGGTDGFLAKFDGSGSRQWGTYYGGIEDDEGWASAADPFGNVYLAGWTQSTVGISTPPIYQNTKAGGTDAFIAKFDDAGARSWATYYGGPDDDYAFGACTDGNGNVYVAGQTNSTVGIASATGYQITYGGGASDAFSVKFKSYGKRACATYYGGTGADMAYQTAVAPGANGNAYLVGTTNSVSGIAVGGYQNTYGGGSWDAFLVGFTPCYHPDLLPIELLEFNATATASGTVEVEWITSTVLEADYFVIESSIDGNDFEEVGMVKGASGSSEVLDYQFLDDQPYAGISYYRLRQVDVSGEHTYSPVRKVSTFEGNGGHAISVFPNPVGDHVTLMLTSPDAGDASITIVNELGETVMQQNLAVSAGSVSLDLNLHNLPQGIYHVKVRLRERVMGVGVVKAH